MIKKGRPMGTAFGSRCDKKLHPFSSFAAMTIRWTSEVPS